MRTFKNPKHRKITKRIKKVRKRSVSRKRSNNHKKSKHQSSIIIFTDGATKNNKRGSIHARGGIGVFFDTKDRRNIADPFLLENPTNNRCELYAVIVAIETVLRNKCTRKKENILIYTDSQHTIDCLDKWIFSWKRNGWIKSDGKPVLNRDLLFWAEGLIRTNRHIIKLEFEHVKAHTKKPKNKRSQEYKKWYGNYMADKLANQGIKKLNKCN